MDTEWFDNERLHRAAQEGDLALVKRLVSEGCDVNMFDDVLSRTPLHYAAEGEFFAVASFLIESGANVNANDTRNIGETPLGHIAKKCSAEMAKLLLVAGANPTIPGWMQITALDRAASKKDSEGQKVHQLMVAFTREKF